MLGTEPGSSASEASAPRLSHLSSPGVPTLKMAHLHSFEVAGE